MLKSYYFKYGVLYIVCFFAFKASASLPRQEYSQNFSNRKKLVSQNVILFHNKEPVCTHQLRPNSNLVPPSFEFSSEGFDPYLKLKENIPACNPEDLALIQQIAQAPLVDERGRVQVAGMHVLAGLAGYCIGGAALSALITNYNINRQDRKHEIPSSVYAFFSPFVALGIGALSIYGSELYHSIRSEIKFGKIATFDYDFTTHHKYKSAPRIFRGLGIAGACYFAGSSVIYGSHWLFGQVEIHNKAIDSAKKIIDFYTPE